MFTGSDRGGERTSLMYALFGTAKLKDVDLLAWLAKSADIPQIGSMKTFPGIRAARHLSCR